jgi:uncharacterized membrane protein YjfL (UPF0719 family)
MTIALVEIAITILLIFLAKWLQDVLTTFDDDHELFTNDNPSLGIAKAGYYVAIIIATKALWEGQGSGDWWEVRDFVVYGALNIILLNAATYSSGQLILRKFNIYHQICEHRNHSISWVLAGCYIGSAFILNGAMAGDDGQLYQSLLEVVCYFISGQLILAMGALVFFKVHQKQSHAIESSNEAAGLAMAGYLIGLGLIVGGLSKNHHALSVADFAFNMATSAASIILLMSVRLFLFPYIFANGHALQKEVFEDKNNAAGWILGLTTIAFAQLALTVVFNLE